MSGEVLDVSIRVLLEGAAREVLARSVWTHGAQDTTPAQHAAAGAFVAWIEAIDARATMLRVVGFGMMQGLFTLGRLGGLFEVRP